MISALSAGIWRGEQKAAKTKPFLGSPWQQWGHKEANQLPINTDRARSCLSCIRQLQAEISAVRSGNRESFGNRARQPKGCAADTAAAPA